MSDGAGTERPTNMIMAADGYECGCRQSSLTAGRRRNRTEGRSAIEDGWQERSIETGQPEQLVTPVPRVEIEQGRARSERQALRPFPAEAKRDVIGRIQKRDRVWPTPLVRFPGATLALGRS